MELIEIINNRPSVIRAGDLYCIKNFGDTGHDVKVEIESGFFSTIHAAPAVNLCNGQWLSVPQLQDKRRFAKVKSGKGKVLWQI